MGRIFDDRGNRMTPSHSRKSATRYRYYVSSALIQGQPESAGSVARVPATKVETVVLGAVRSHIGRDAPIDNAELISTHVRQIEVSRTEIAISLPSQDNATDDGNDNPFVLTVPWSKTPHRRHRDVIVPEGSSPAEALPIRSDTRQSSSPRLRADGSGCQRSRPAPRQSTTSPHDGPAASATSICRSRWPSSRRASSKPPSKVDCHTGSASHACSTRQSRGRASFRCWGSCTDAPIFERLMVRVPPHNRLVAGSSPASSTTQSCAIPVSRRVWDSL